MNVINDNYCMLAIMTQNYIYIIIYIFARELSRLWLVLACLEVFTLKCNNKFYNVLLNGIVVKVRMVKVQKKFLLKLG